MFVTGRDSRSGGEGQDHEMHPKFLEGPHYTSYFMQTIEPQILPLPFTGEENEHLFRIKGTKHRLLKLQPSCQTSYVHSSEDNSPQENSRWEREEKQDTPYKAI